MYTDNDDVNHWGTDTDSYKTSRHDDFFPDEYEIPLWSANVFPGVVNEIMDTMKKLREIETVVEGINLIHQFRSKLSPSPHHHGRPVNEDTVVSDDRGIVESSIIPLSRKRSSYNLFTASETGRGCAHEELCISNHFASCWRVAPRERMEHFVHGKLVSFGEKVAGILPGLAYKIQSGTYLKRFCLLSDHSFYFIFISVPNSHNLVLLSHLQATSTKLKEILKLHERNLLQ